MMDWITYGVAAATLLAAWLAVRSNRRAEFEGYEPDLAGMIARAEQTPERV